MEKRDGIITPDVVRGMLSATSFDGSHYGRAIPGKPGAFTK